MHYWNRSLEKVVNTRIECILSDPYLFEIYKQFGMPYLRRSSVFHGLGTFLKDNNVKGKVCLEVGTWNGLTAAILSRHFELVVSLDIAHNKEKYAVIHHLGLKNIKCIDIEDNNEKAKIIKKHSFDFAYLDGNHEHDTFFDWGLVKHCGRVLFHEAWPHQKPVWELLESLPKGQVIHGGDGLALWDKTRGF